MLLIYYNPNDEHFYFKVINFAVSNKSVDEVNQFNHQIVQILYVRNNKFISCDSFLDYYQKTKDNNISKKNKLIDKVICLLNKFKD